MRSDKNIQVIKWAGLELSEECELSWSEGVSTTESEISWSLSRKLGVSLSEEMLGVTELEPSSVFNSRTFSFKSKSESFKEWRLDPGMVLVEDNIWSSERLSTSHWTCWLSSIAFLKLLMWSKLIFRAPCTPFNWISCFTLSNPIPVPGATVTTCWT